MIIRRSRTCVQPGTFPSRSSIAVARCQKPSSPNARQLDAGTSGEHHGEHCNRTNEARTVKRVEAAHRYDVAVERGFSFITDTANWSTYWPGFVRLEGGSSWGAVGDTARLTTRLLGRERELTMTITAFEPNRLVTYTSTQPGLPDARHERHFEDDGEGFVYRLVVEYEPRDGLAGLFDQVLLERGIRRAFQSTFVALERELEVSAQRP